MFEDTIIAVSTPPGYGGLGIVRLSGERSLSIARKIFRSRSGGRAKIPLRSPVYGRLYDFLKKEPFDEALLTYFKAPGSYTKEDVVELSCHGSPATLETAVRLGVRGGARLARPGEFTLRAYLNGRIDILQAEAVNDLIRAASPLQARISYRQLDGSLSHAIGAIRKKIVQLIAQLEAGIEFPDERLKTGPKRHSRALASLRTSIASLVASYEKGRALSTGISLAITGRANVGKSTLFNALLNEERAIVTPHPGTTRDFLREPVFLDGFLFHLIDMAGLGKAAHPVEKAGMTKGRRVARAADGLLLVIDGSRKETPEDLRLLDMFQEKKRLVVINKSDLPRRLDVEKILSVSGGAPLVEVSAMKKTNFDALKKKILAGFLPSRDFSGEVLLHERQKILLEEIENGLKKAAALLEKNYSEEFLIEEIRSLLPLIGELMGEIHSDEVLEDIFNRFCVGK